MPGREKMQQTANLDDREPLQDAAQYGPNPKESDLMTTAWPSRCEAPTSSRWSDDRTARSHRVLTQVGWSATELAREPSGKFLAKFSPPTIARLVEGEPPRLPRCQKVQQRAILRPVQARGTKPKQHTA